MAGSIILVWDNFGYMHMDRCEALARYYFGRRKVVGIEIADSSSTYNWSSGSPLNFKKVTLYKGKAIENISILRRVVSTIIACWREGHADVFLCHYEHVATVIVAFFLRLLGRRVYVMNNSKFDDKDRKVFREFVKSIFFLPYFGALSAGHRSADYLRFLGIRSSYIALGYNTLSLSRVRDWAEAPPAPHGLPLAHRHFTVVARFVPKKNVALAIEAYKLYRTAVDHPQELHLCGYGPLEVDLRSLVSRYGLEDSVIFHGGLQNEDVCKLLTRTSVLLLPSIEEQFGNVVIEAQALGVPAIVSDNCGCWDELVRSGVNGFVVEPDNEHGLAYFMQLLTTRPSLWREMCLESLKYSQLGDVDRFSKGIETLIEDDAVRTSPLNLLNLN